MRSFWDQRYSVNDYVYGTRPNAFIKEFIDQNPPGLGLFPGEGEGRNAVYAASKGWRVTAFDYSENARLKALDLAVREEVWIDYHLSDAGSFDFQQGIYDGVFICYFHLPPRERRLFHRRVVESLSENGYVIMEVFSKEQLKYRSGGPKTEELLYSAEELKGDFRDLEISQIENRIVTLQEGSFHQGEASVIRLIAGKSQVSDQTFLKNRNEHI